MKSKTLTQSLRCETLIALSWKILVCGDKERLTAL